MATIVKLSPEYFPDPTKGRPVSNGSIYIGEPDLDPEVVANRIQVTAVQENGSSVLISQPIETGAGGMPLYNGSNVTLTVSASYSIKVLDSTGTQVYYVANNFAQDVSGLLFLSDYSCDIAAAVADIGSVIQTTLIVDCACIIDSGTTVESTDNISLNVVGSGSFDGVLGGGTETLNINGPILAGAYKIYGENLVVGGDQLTEITSPEWFGAVGDGVTNDYAAFARMAAALPDGANVVLTNSKNYYLNTAATITFPNRVNISGPGMITVGATVGVRNAIEIDGDGSVLKDFEVVGDITNFTDSGADDRILVWINGDDVLVDNVTFTDFLYAIVFSGPDNVTIRNSKFINDTLDRDFGSTVRNCFGIWNKADSINTTMEGNYFKGSGQGITSGYRCYGQKIINNDFKLQGDNGLYVYGYGSVISGNSFADIVNHGVVSYGSQSIITDNTFITTGSYEMFGMIRLQASDITTGHVADSEGNTSHDMLVSNNVGRGQFYGDIIRVSPYHSASNGISNVTVSNNIIDVPTVPASGNRRGMLIYAENDSGSVDQISHGLSVTGNVIKGCLRGMLISTTTPVGYYDNAIINDNSVYNSSVYGMSFVGVEYSQISNNVVFDETDSGDSIILTTCTNNQISNNVLGAKTAFTNKNGFDLTTCTGNDFIDNKIMNLAYANHYSGIDATSSVQVDLLRVVTSAITTTMKMAEGSKFLVTTSGSGIGYEPSGTFCTGYQVAITNVDTGNITFNSAGLGATILPEETGRFIYTGAAWLPN